jgi:hypothetical protein
MFFSQLLFSFPTPIFFFPPRPITAPSVCCPSLTNPLQSGSPSSFSAATSP